MVESSCLTKRENIFEILSSVYLPKSVFKSPPNPTNFYKKSCYTIFSLDTSFMWSRTMKIHLECFNFFRRKWKLWGEVFPCFWRRGKVSSFFLNLQFFKLNVKYLKDIMSKFQVNRKKLTKLSFCLQVAFFYQLSTFSNFVTVKSIVPIHL